MRTLRYWSPLGIILPLSLLLLFVVLAVRFRDTWQPSKLRQDPHSPTFGFLMQKIDRLSISLADLWCSSKNLGYTGGFCLTAEQVFQGGNHMWDLGLCKALEDLFGPTSVGDFGAGLGPYGRCLLRRKDKVFALKNQKTSNEVNEKFLSKLGDHINETRVIYSWDGFDGAGNVEVLSGGFIKQRDLTEANLWLGRQWDWVLSLEVGEHVPKHYESNFINNIVNHGCQGIVISWALPGQGGHNHINEQSTTYIKERFATYGLENDVDAELVLRKASKFSYFRKNLMVFRYLKPKDCKTLNP